jgi:phage shock protein E
MKVAALTVLALSAFGASPASGEHPNLGWALQTIKVEALKTLLDHQQKPIVIDVRSSDAFRDGHIPGARSLSLDEPGDRFRELPRRATIVLYCSCPVSEIGPAYQFLRFSGFDDVRVLEGGFAAWVGRGYPVGK